MQTNICNNNSNYLCSGIGFLCFPIFVQQCLSYQYYSFNSKNIFKGSNTGKIFTNPTFIAQSQRNGFILQISDEITFFKSVQFFFQKSELSDAGIYSGIKEYALVTKGDNILKLQLKDYKIPSHSYQMILHGLSIVGHVSQINCRYLLHSFSKLLHSLQY